MLFDIELGPALVVALYGAALALILSLPRSWVEPDGRVVPWWRSVRLWASLVAVVQMIVYARWG